MNIHSLIAGDGTICVVIDGTHYTVGVGHTCYEKIRKGLTTLPVDESAMREHFNIPEHVRQLTSGKVRLDLDQAKVWYDDTEFCDEEFCKRALKLLEQEHDTSCLVNFLNNLGQNPSYRSVMETFKFLCNEGMPITSDGCFLAYKGVAEDFYDVHSNTVNNTPDGRRIEMPRENVCDDSGQSCASGYHVGSYSYACGWGKRVVLVKVNPKDVVSVPNHECEKMRVCGYWVVKDFSTDIDKPMPILDGDLYDVDGNKIQYSDYFTKCCEESKASYDFDTSLEDDEDGRGYCDWDDDYDDNFDEDDYDEEEDEDEEDEGEEDNATPNVNNQCDSLSKYNCLAKWWFNKMCQSR